MILLLFRLTLSQTISTDFTASFPLSAIASFGFDKGGTFSIKIIPRKTSPSLLFISKRPDSSQAFKAFCTNTSAPKPVQNVSLFFARSQVTFTGKISEAGTYVIYIATCSNTLSSFHVDMVFSNPSSQIDSRNEHLPLLYKYLAAIYLGIFVLWLSHAPFLHIFKFPLHTTFMFLPLVKSLTLYTYNRYWCVLRETDKPPYWMEVVTHGLDLVYYAALTSSLTFLCSGCNIFRNKYNLIEHLDIIISSCLLTFGVIMVPLVQSEKGLMASIVVLSVGVIWNLNIFIVSMVKTSRLMERAKSRKWLSNRVMKAKKFVISNILIVLCGIIIYVALFLASVPAVACTATLEVIALIWTFLQMKFYVLKSGPELSPEEVPRSSVRAVVLHCPNGSVRAFVGRL